MALMEGLGATLGGKIALFLGALALRKPPPFQPVPLPALPWAGAEPAPAPAKQAARPTPYITLEQVLEWGEGCDQALADHPVQMHAHRLLLWLNQPEVARSLALDSPSVSRGKIVRGLFAYQLEEQYLSLCAETLWWKPHRWEGSNGVAEHFRRLTGKPKGYKYTVWEGSEHRWCFYPVPAPVSGQKAAKPIPAPTPKRKPKSKKRRLRAPDNLKRAA
jgi:hypothetical protein